MDMLLSVVTLFVVYIFLYHTYTGKAVRAYEQEPEGAALSGINTSKVGSITAGIAFSSAAVAGIALSMIYPFEPPIHLHWLVILFLVVILGGVGSVPGTLVAGIIAGLIVTVSGVWIPYSLVNLVMLWTLRLILAIRPKGFCPMITKIKSNKELLCIIIGVIGLALLPYLGISLYLITFLFILLFNCSLTVGWNILGGYGGYVSFGHVAFVGAGGYTTALLLNQLGWSPLLTALPAGIVAALIALVIGYPCLRLRGPYFSLITLIIALALKVVVINLPGLNIGAGIFLTNPAADIYNSRLIIYQAMLVIFFVTLVTAFFIEKSRFGIGLKAIREDEEVATTQGINTTSLKLSAFVLSAGLAGLAGGIYSWYQGFLFPDPMFSVNLTVLIMLMALIE